MSETARRLNSAMGCAQSVRKNYTPKRTTRAPLNPIDSRESFSVLARRRRSERGSVLLYAAQVSDGATKAGQKRAS